MPRGRPRKNIVESVCVSENIIEKKELNENELEEDTTILKVKLYKLKDKYMYKSTNGWLYNLEGELNGRMEGEKFIKFNGKW